MGEERGYRDQGGRVQIHLGSPFPRCPPITLLQRWCQWVPCGSLLGGAWSRPLPVLVRQKPHLLLESLKLLIFSGSCHCCHYFATLLFHHPLHPVSTPKNCCWDYQICLTQSPRWTLLPNKYEGSEDCLSCWTCIANHRQRGCCSCLTLSPRRTCCQNKYDGERHYLSH
jgi:hypothetical protein